MEAIVEMFVALVMALVHLLAAVMTLLFGFIGLLIEFAFLALTQGLSKASDKFEQRKQKLTQTLDGSNENGEDESALESTKQFQLTARQSAILAGLVVMIVAGAAIIWFVSERIRKDRVAKTKSQITILADDFIAQVKSKPPVIPQEGKLSDLDAWRQPIELFVDRALTGSMIVVRSSGPDRRLGTIDDILAIRSAPSTVKEVGGALVKQGMQAVKDRLRRFLPVKNGEELPENIVVEDE